MNHYRILWRSKTDKRRGFDLVDAEDEEKARSTWLETYCYTRSIERVQEVEENGDLKQ